MPEAKTNVMRILESAHIPYVPHRYDPAQGIDGVSVAHQLGQDPEQVYKTLVCKGKGGGFFVFVIPVGRELDLKRAARAVGEKAVELIPVKELSKTTGYIRGGCSPVGMKKPFPTAIERAAEGLERFCVSAGKPGHQVELNPRQLAALVGAQFAEIAL